MINMRGAVVVKHYTGGNWVDSTNGILQVDINRGIPQYDGCWSQVQPGQLTLRSRDLSLGNIALQTRIRIEVDGTPIFTGKVFDITTDYVPREDSIVTIIAFDELAALSLKKYNHPTTIGHDYAQRTVAHFTTFPGILQGTTFEEGDFYYQHQTQGTYKEGDYAGPIYSTANTDYGVSGFNPPAPPPGGASDTNWEPYLADQDGLIVANPSWTAGPGLANQSDGFGRIPHQYWSSTTNKINSLPTPDQYGSIRHDFTNPLSPISASRSGVLDTGHPLSGSTGFWKTYFRASGAAPTYLANYAALMTTNDTDMLTLFLKAEQAEAGFAYVDVKNRFRIYSRAVVDNDQHLSKATFASDGSGISYNNIKVTNGWEGVVNGVTINNTWSNEFINFYNIGPWGYLWEASYPDFNRPNLTNRDGTTTAKILNDAPSPIPTGYPKDYEWLGYDVTETTRRWLKYASTNTVTQSPIWDVKTRNPELDKLTTISYFQGQQGLGTKQLSLNTNYAFNLNTGAGYMWNKNGTTKAFDRLTDDALPDYNVIERSAELADYILTNYSNPVQDIRTINFDVRPQDLDTIKDIDIYDRIDIDHDYAGFVRDKQYCVMGITHSITPNSWNVTYQLWNQDGRP